jgi:sporulation protein YunB
LLGFGAFLVASALYLKRISGQIAVSDACDIMTTQVNAAITQVLQEGDYDADWFVSFEKNEAGEVTAISSNMTHINALSALLLDRVIGLTGNRNLTVSIPAGNLTGLSLLMGRGPGIPVEIMVLTSSHVEFRNNIVTAGINQTKHQISLLVIVDIDVLVPWGTENAQICTELLIADTVVVGQVPETYLNFDQNKG